MIVFGGGSTIVFVTCDLPIVYRQVVLAVGNVYRLILKTNSGGNQTNLSLTQDHKTFR